MSRRVSENITIYSYDKSTNIWTNKPSLICRDKIKFDSGGVRQVYRAWFVGREDKPMVLKLEIDVRRRTESDTKKDVIMQHKCMKYAELYNAQPGIPKRVKFVKSEMIKFLHGEFKNQFGSIEPYLEGIYMKHNNAHGTDNGTAYTGRNTPQAFSHFTLTKSGNQEMVVDIQGVGDIYTDPQIFSVTNVGCGAANWGPSGIVHFYVNHKCNEICKALGLPSINPAAFTSGTQLAPY